MNARVRRRKPRQGRTHQALLGAPSLMPGSPIQVVHAKPWKRTVVARGTVVSWDGNLLKIERQFSAGGTYDSLNLPKLGGDYGFIEVRAGGWILRRTYFRQDGTLIGELFNVQTPAQVDPGRVHYVDLEIDVVRWPDGQVAVVDEEDLEAAVRQRGVTPEMAERARGIAHRLAHTLRAGGVWMEVDRELRAAGGAPGPAEG